ncbi:NAD(P)H dehydrogenase (quinone) [Planctomycetales bacterium]|nr:NAD(P)H dehydrogenase (quinone) [Planctomycetales bacterium]
MQILLIVAQNKKSCFNHGITERAAAVLKELGHTVFIHDLYAEHFDPVLPLGEDSLPENDLPQVIQDYLAEVRSADGLIFVHPNWWGSPPAVLRGWVERVFRQGSVYNFTPQGPVSYIGGKTVQVFSTSNTPRDIELNVYHDPIQNFWETVVFGLLGCKSFERRNFEQIILSTPEEREKWLDEVEKTIKRRFAAV